MEKRLEHVTLPHCVKLCPSMDLVAVVDSNRLDVFRFDGQRALVRTRNDSQCTIDSMAWLANGSGISLIWDDEMVDVVDSAQGKLVKQSKGRTERGRIHAGSVQAASQPRRSLGHSWAVILVDSDSSTNKGQTMQRTSPFVPEPKTPSGVDSQGGEDEEKAHLEQLFKRVPDKGHLHAIADLPHQLALLDAVEELPSLSPLPSTGDGTILSFAPDAFSTQTNVEDTLYASSPRKKNGNIIDVMLTYWDDHAVTMSCGGVICESRLEADAVDAIDRLRGQASHPFASCHAMVLQRGEDRHLKLSIEIIALNALPQTGQLFNLITSKMNTLKQLSQYVVHCVAATRGAWNTSQALPQRFVSSVKDELAKRKHPMSVEAALTHQAVTGAALPEVREWLSEELQERGHKRWDAAVVNGYTHIIDLVHTHLLPALDYASIIASRLRALCRMEPSLPPMRIPVRNLSRILTDLDSLRLISHRILEYASEELHSFRVFSTWLQLQITITRAEPNSTAANDAAERAAGVDCGTLLSYIEGPLRLSQLNYILGRSSEEVSEALRRPGDQLKRWLLIRILEKHDKEAMQPKQREEGGSVEAVNALWQALMLRDGIKDVVEASHEAIGKGIESTGGIMLDSHPVALQSTESTRINDVRMVAENTDLGIMCTYLIDAVSQPAAARLHRVLHHRYLGDISRTIEDSIIEESHPWHTSKVVRLPTFDVVLPETSEGALVTLRFLTDDVMLVLMRSKSSELTNLELHWAFYGAAAGMAVESPNRDFSETQCWTPGWKLGKRWTSEQMRGFVPKAGSVELRLELSNRPNDTSPHHSRRVVLCMLEERGERYRIEEAEIVL